VATPLEVYHRPANLFVAEFVGMPRINLLPARVAWHDGSPWLETEAFRLPAPWAPPQNDVIVAARPEDVSLLLEPEADAVQFRVYAVLPAGPELLIHVQHDDTALVVRETRQLDLQMDQSVWVKIDPSAINLYDKASGRLLTPDSS